MFRANVVTSNRVMRYLDTTRETSEKRCRDYDTVITNKDIPRLAQAEQMRKEQEQKNSSFPLEQLKNVEERCLVKKRRNA